MKFQSAPRRDLGRNMAKAEVIAELMGVYPTQQKAFDACHVREMYEGGMAGEKEIQGSTLKLELPNE